MRPEVLTRVSNTDTMPHSQDLLEIIDDCYGCVSSLVASQVPMADWFVRFPDATLDDGILDRIIHDACRPNFESESQRKTWPAAPMSST